MGVGVQGCMGVVMTMAVTMTMGARINAEYSYMDMCMC